MVRGLFFDVFGTCVDWRSGVIRDGTGDRGDRRRLARVRGRVARRLPAPAGDGAQRAAREWVVLDVLHREALDRLLGEFGIEGSTSPPGQSSTSPGTAWTRGRTRSRGCTCSSATT